uniref:Uncharacterized protein n=1 Tax=Glossina pallidipes TaxID=7398 RepID=A0A1B0A706_GLOPL
MGPPVMYFNHVPLVILLVFVFTVRSDEDLVREDPENLISSTFHVDLDSLRNQFIASGCTLGKFYGHKRNIENHAAEKCSNINQIVSELYAYQGKAWQIADQNPNPRNPYLYCSMIDILNKRVQLLFPNIKFN